MKLIEPKVEILQQKPGLLGIYEIIDEVAGICYNRQGIHENSEAFVRSLIKRGHLSPLEFGTVYLRYLANPYEINPNTLYHNYTDNPYSVVIVRNGYIHVTTNYRVLEENGWLDDLQYICEPTEYHTKRPCFKITCSRGIADEFARHRTLSIMMRSTRYCKANNLEICRPQWLDKSITEDILDKNLESDYGESNYKLWAW